MLSPDIIKIVAVIMNIGDFRKTNKEFHQEFTIRIHSNSVMKRSMPIAN